MQVLVADDDAVGRQMIATAIELLGHEVTQVADGRDALDRFIAHPYQIVVLDWVMPNLDGISAARRIRALSTPEPVPTEDLIDGAMLARSEPMILLATAYDDAHLVAAALEAGIDDYMIKPMSMAEIRARIAIAVERYHLRRRVADRERALRRQRAQAEAISLARARFLSNMSHELRTPLNGMVGMADFLRSQILSTEETEAVDIIRASALSLGAIIDDILDLTQVDEGRVQLDPRPFVLRHLVKQIVGLYSARASKAGLQLQSEVDDGVPDVLVGDPGRIRQVLSNFLNNAVKFTESGWIRLAVSTSDPKADPPRFRFSVVDSGPGIDAKHHATLFERFERAPETETPGHGLGLAICRGLSELMGGTVGLQSTVGEGSTFWVDLPLSPTDVSPEKESTATIRQPTRPIRTLVVEDDRFNQTVARRLLERAGCTVRVAENGQAALRAVAFERPEIIFMDVQMPVMDGLDAAREIRRGEGEDEHVPIVGLTASSVAGARRLCQEAGMDGYLQKPVQLAMLIDALVEYVPSAYG